MKPDAIRFQRSRPAGTVWAENLGKRYSLYRSPLQRLQSALFRGSVDTPELVALEQVTFEINPGTAVGVIGPNGAGKSTLLKILSGVLTPSTGRMGVEGRIASIIELGAGFHPEFTGRDNVLMNAELHGLSREQAQERIEPIARFSELGRYFDMPVKTYSSGMFVRLAFSLAISVDPDVLLVDEALAVGDAVFVHRCLTRIRDLREKGVTIFLVTHDTPTVANLCDRALLIHGGKLIADGTPKEVIHRYLIQIAERLTRLDSGETTAGGFHTIGAHEASLGTDSISEARFGSFEAHILNCWVENEEGQRVNQVLSGSRVRLCMEVRFDRDVAEPIFGIMIRNRFGVEMFGTNTRLRQDPVCAFHHGDYASVTFELPLLLDGGGYGVTFAVHAPDGNYYDYRNDALVVEVVSAGDSGGLVRLPVEVRISKGRSNEQPEQDHPLTLAFTDASPRLLFSDPNAARFLSGEVRQQSRDSQQVWSLQGEGRFILGGLSGTGAARFLRLSLLAASSQSVPIEAWADCFHLGAETISTGDDHVQWLLPDVYRQANAVVAIRLRSECDSLPLRELVIVEDGQAAVS